MSVEHLFLPTSEETSTNYNETAENYETDPIEHPEILIDILKSLDKATKPVALVIGCGPADDAQTLTEIGFAVIGIDNSPGMIAVAKERNPKIKVREMDMINAGKKFKKNQFDLIFAHYSLFHERKENLAKTIHGFAKILKEGGYIYLTTQESMSGYPYETFSQRYDDNNRVYINAETEESLTQLFSDSGIEITFVARRNPSAIEHQFFKLTMAGQKVA